MTLVDVGYAVVAGIAIGFAVVLGQELARFVLRKRG